MTQKTKKAPRHSLVPLSQCGIWQQQQAFYCKETIHAWTDKIPFYITSNPYIANSYANVMMRFMQDCQRTQHYRPLEPFYIIELGAGSGTFSFYTLKRLCELQQALHLKEISWVYVMTDLVESNVQFWRTHPALQPYIQQGILDFACYNAETDQTIQLLQTGKHLVKPDAQRTDTTPFIMIANYVFDTLSQDVFRLQSGKLEEAMLEKTTRIADVDLQEKPYIKLNDLNTLSYQPITLPHYKDNDLNAVLAHYTTHPTDSYLLFPIGSLKAIKNLATIANNRLLLLSTDKGYSHYFASYSQDQPDLTFHTGCFSMMVNYHAIGNYFRQRNGDYYHQPTQQSTNTSAFTLGFTWKDFIETQQATKTYFDSLSHVHFFNFYSHIILTKHQCPLETLISYLSATQWDPTVFNYCFDVILARIKQAPGLALQDLIEGMPKIAANFYGLPSSIDTLSNIGVLFQELGYYTEALHYYQQSLQSIGQVSTTFYNMGLCYYLLKDYAKAQQMFKSTLKLTPDYILAKGWISHIKTEYIQSGKATKSQLTSTPTSASIPTTLQMPTAPMI